MSQGRTVGIVTGHVLDVWRRPRPKLGCGAKERGTCWMRRVPGRGHHI